MRALDVLVVIGGVAVAVLVARGWRNRRTAGLVAALASVAGLGFWVAGPRWQLLPALAIVAVGVGVVVLRGVRGTSGARPRRGLGVAAGAVAVLGGVLGWILPVPTLPAPRGPFGVGTVTFTVTDPDRSEIYTDDPDDVRSFPVQVWYPAEATTPVAPLVASEAAGPFSAAAGEELGLPPFALTHLDLVDTHAVAGAAPADADGGDFGVVVYSHGWTGFRSVHLDLAEELASRGYVVVAADHTYGALATRFPDGDVVPLNPGALPDGAPEDAYDRAATTLEDTFAADVVAMLEVLADPDDPRLSTGGAPGVGELRDLTGRLALDEVVLTGHSTGGGAVTWACARVEACAGVVGFDPWVEPVPEDVVTQGLDVPYLALRSAAWVGNDNDAVVDDLLAASTGRTWRLSVEGSAHRDFTVLGYLSPLASFFGAGDVDVGTFHDAVEDLTAAFVDHVLGGAGTGLLDAPPSPVLHR